MKVSPSAQGSVASDATAFVRPGSTQHDGARGRTLPAPGAPLHAEPPADPIGDALGELLDATPQAEPAQP